jgi:hypothetical protein
MPRARSDAPIRPPTGLSSSSAPPWPGSPPRRSAPCSASWSWTSRTSAASGRASGAGGRPVRWPYSAVEGSAFYTDELASYNDLARSGKHVPIDHGETYADGAAHINGLEGFWSYAKGLHRPCHGVDREDFPTYLAEYEFRYNHRDDHLLTILFEAVIRPEISGDGSA